MSQPAYAETLKDGFGLDQGVAAFSSQTLGGAEISVTRVCCSQPNNGLTNPLPREDAWLVTTQLRDCPAHDLWIDGRAMRSGPLKRGDTSFYDLQSDPRVYSVSAFDNVHFHIDRATLRAIAEADGLDIRDGVPHEPGLGLSDPIIAGLTLALRPSFEQPVEVNRLFVDHVTQAVAGHVTSLFARGAKRTRRGAPAGAVRRSQEILAANLAGDLTISDVSQGSGLSPHAFAAEFTDATGRPPHRWLMEQRVRCAQDLLRTSRLSVAEIAKACGFASEAHLERVFRVSLGCTSRSVRPRPS